MDEAKSTTELTQGLEEKDIVEVIGIKITKRALFRNVFSFALFFFTFTTILHLLTWTNNWSTIDETNFGFALRLGIPYVTLFAILITAVEVYALILIIYYFIVPIFFRYKHQFEYNGVHFVHIIICIVFSVADVVGIVFLRIHQPRERLSQIAIPLGSIIFFAVSIIFFPWAVYKMHSRRLHMHHKKHRSHKYVSPYTVHFYTCWFFILNFVFGCLFFTTAPIWFDTALVIDGSIPPKPKLIGHRGFSNEAPENTISSFKLALELGVWGVESDLRFATDQVF